MKENIEEDIKIIKRLITTKFNNDYSIDNKDKEAIDNILSDYKRVLKENEELKAYIMLAPNLDEMTAMKYSNIQKEAYIRGRAEEQQKAEQIIYENYIPIEKIEGKIQDLKKEYKMELEKNSIKAFILKCQIKALQELLKGENDESI